MHVIISSRKKIEIKSLEENYLILQLKKVKNNKEYFYIDLHIKSMKVVKWGISNTATLTGDTADKYIHRIFLTQGQYNKLVKYLD